MVEKRTTPSGHAGKWLALAGFAVLAVLAGWPVVATVRDPVGGAPPRGFEAMLAETAYETSDNCLVCHPDHHESWARTYHRTMTQTAGPHGIVAPFDGRAIRVNGVSSKPWRDESGRYFIDTPHPLSGETTSYEILRTVGSRRMQQYVTKIGDRYVRLPLAYSMVEGRWFHLSEAFFHPDGESFHQYTSVWDYNCIFCHNVKGSSGWQPDAPVPKIVTDTGTSGPFTGSFDSSVAELGIACEACHGPGEEHAERMRSPARRYAMRWASISDPTIINPEKLEQQRSNQLCGHCHGQRVPASDATGLRLLMEGDPYTPGEELGRTWSTVSSDTVYKGFAFAPRFWKDGSPRLTAFEFQGLNRSPCAVDPDFTCISCHAMHDGDPKGQLRPDRPGNEMCTGCHEEFAGGRKLVDHTKHPADDASSRCTACHMPDEVYGVMSWHPSHQIQNPDPVASARSGKPDACTMCHTARSRRWAAEQLLKLWPGSEAGKPADLDNLGVPVDLAEIPRALFSADAVYRTLAAHRLGFPLVDRRDDPVEPADGLDHSNPLYSTEPVFALLAQATLDRYPNVRRTAWLSLRRLSADNGELAGVKVPMAHSNPSERMRFADQWGRYRVGAGDISDSTRPFFDGHVVDRGLLQRLISQRDEIPVSIGE